LHGLLIAFLFPRGDLPFYRVLIGQASIQTLSLEHAEFDLSHIGLLATFDTAGELLNIGQVARSVFEK